MNPNNSRPMSYDSLKTLLQYAKPNLRFELSLRMPSIQLTEKLVPLRIDKLLIDYHGIEVNDTKYEAHTVRHFPLGAHAPRWLPFDNTFHEGDWDLDEWGFDDFSSENVFTPGDLVLQVEGQEPRQKEQGEERKKEIENELKFVEWMIARKLGKNVEPHWTGEVVQPSFEDSCKESSSIELRQKVETCKVELASYNSFENNTPLPFTKMVQVAVRSKNGSICWRYSGNLKHYEIKKQLMTWLLGNRKPVIHVNHLIVTNGIIARLPENLRMSVKALQTQTFSSSRIQVDTNTMLNKLEAIIHNNNCPLEVFETDILEEDFDHPMGINAKKLIWSPRTIFPSADRLIQISYQQLHISCFLRSGYFLPEDILQLIEDWIENPREIGKCLSFDGLEELVMRTMSQVKATFDGIKTKQSIKIPVNNYSQISVSYESEVIMKRDTRLRLMAIEVEAA